MSRFWVISPNVWNDSSQEGWKQWIEEEHKIAVGRKMDDKEGGKQFANDISIGDTVLVAQGSNKNKKLFLAGIVYSEAKESDNDGYYQWRQLENVLSKQELEELNIQFSSKNKFGESKQHGTLYFMELNNPADKKIINKIEKSIEEKYSMQPYIDLLKQQKNIVLTGAPGTGKTFLAKQIAKEMTKEASIANPVDSIEQDPISVLKNTLESMDDKNEDIKEYKYLLEEFNLKFPKDQLKDLTLEQYCLGTENYKNTFSYWVEYKLKKIGYFFPGTSFGHYIYFSVKEDKYVSKDEDSSPEDIMKKIANSIYSLVNEKSDKNMEVELTSAHKIKILHSYYPDEYFPIPSKKLTDNICDMFKIEKVEDEISKNKNILDFYRTHPQFKKYDVLLIKEALFKSFNLMDGEIIKDDKIVLEGDYSFVQFHPSYDYTDFVEGLRPYQKDNNEIGFELQNGIFKKLCIKAFNNPNKNYVMIIDEINRAELSKVFGELFFSIESGYRGEKGRVELQYSNLYKEDSDEYYDPFKYGFYVPENVYIIGTMNDIDRSIEPFDFAMKRRFAWHEIKPTDTCESMWKNKDWKDEAKKRMINLNNKISDKFSSAYEIGGSYFLKLNEPDNDFNELWKYHIEPVLKDYVKGRNDKKSLLDEFKTAFNTTSEEENKIQSNGTVDASSQE